MRNQISGIVKMRSQLKGCLLNTTPGRWLQESRTGSKIPPTFALLNRLNENNFFVFLKAALSGINFYTEKEEVQFAVQNWFAQQTKH
jgi:hypothetical protein